MRHEVDELALNLTVSCELATLLSLALLAATGEEMQELLLLVQMRKVAYKEEEYVLSDKLDERIINKAKLILNTWAD